MARITTSSSAAAMSTAAVGDSPKMVVRSTTVERGSAEAPSSLFVVVELERSVLTVPDTLPPGVVIVPDALVPAAGAGDGSFVAGADGKLEDEDEPWASTSATGAAIRAAPSRAACKNFIPHLPGGTGSKAGATERAEVGRGRRMSTWDTLPAQLNVATWFVDRNVADGAGAAPASRARGRRRARSVPLARGRPRQGVGVGGRGRDLERRSGVLGLLVRVQRLSQGRRAPAPRHGRLLRDVCRASTGAAPRRQGVLRGQALLRLRARQRRVLPDGRGGAERALPAPADARRRVRGHRALPADDLLRRADALRGHARAERAGEALGRLLPASLRLGGRGAARGALQPLARALRR